jgi:hypothetical protein
MSAHGAGSSEIHVWCFLPTMGRDRAGCKSPARTHAHAEGEWVSGYETPLSKVNPVEDQGESNLTHLGQGCIGSVHWSAGSASRRMVRPSGGAWHLACYQLVVNTIINFTDFTLPSRDPRAHDVDRTRLRIR